MLKSKIAMALAAAMVLVALYGCSSSGGIKTDRDMYKEQAEQLAIDKAELETMLTAAKNDADGDGTNDRVAELETMLTAAKNDADGDGTNDRVAELETMLTAAKNDADGDGTNDRVAELETMLTAAKNDADGDGTNDRVAELETMLTAAKNDADGDGTNDRVAELETMLTAAKNDADGDGTNDRVAELETMLTAAKNDADGDGTNDRVAELETMLAAAENDADGDGTNDRVAELETMLAAAKNDADDDGENDEVTRLTVLLYGVDGTSDNPTEDSLQGKLDAQKDAIDKVAAAKESMMAMSLMPTLLTAVEDGADVPKVDVSYDGGAMAKITDYGDAASAGSRDGYAGFEIVKDDATSTDTVLVFTNVGTDGPKALIVDEGAMGMNTWFAVTDGDDAGEAFAKHARASGFPSAPPTGATTVLLGTAVTSPGSDMVDRVEFDGTWRGISGLFVCSECETQQLEVSAKLVDDEEVLTVNFRSQEWVFQPTNVKATVDVPDDDYLTFGFWKSLPNADDGTYNFATFFDGAQPLASGTATALEGEAKFVGVAAGKYIVKEGSSFSPVFRPGVFTAKATLTADFGADNENGTISGSISAFLEGGEPIDGNWGVRLGSLGIGADGTFDSATDATDDEPATEATIHGVKSMTSQWNGGLYNGGDAVAGEFQASFAEGAANVAGAFGATEE